MSVLTVIKLYASTAAVFFAVDLVWLGVVAADFYRKHLGHLMRPDVQWAPALLFYLLYLAGVLVFAVLPGLESGSLARAVTLGALFGLVAYATFDLTCMALFRDFPLVVVVVDLCWGTLLTGGVAAAGWAVGRWLGLGPA